jgi:nitronate monooxygenase
MSLDTRLTSLLGIGHPVIQAGMDGGATTPGLVATVSEAGGLGTLVATYMTPDAMGDAMSTIRSLTERPFAINLFVPEPFDPSIYTPKEVNASLAPYREELGIEAPKEISYVQPFEDQLAVVLEEMVPIFSFTFGVPDEAQLSALKEAGTSVIRTATTALKEATEAFVRGGETSLSCVRSR